MRWQRKNRRLEASTSSDAPRSSLYGASLSDLELWGSRPGAASAKTRRSRLRLALVLALLGSYIGCLFVVMAHRRGLDAFGSVDTSSTKDKKSQFANQDPMFNVSSPDRRHDCVFELPDIGFEWLGPMGVPELTEFWVVSGVLVTVIRFVFCPIGATVIKRWLLCIGILSVIRGLSRLLTVRPVPGSRCPYEDDREVSAAWVALLVLLKQAPTCADVLFSLHVVNLSLCALVWLFYIDVMGPMGASKRTVRYVVIFYLIVGYALILATRSHYTADIFLWFLVSALLWMWYHHWIQICKLDSLSIIGGKRLAPYNWLSKATLWFEAEAEDLDFRPFSSSDQVREESIHRKRNTSTDSVEDDPEYDAAFQTVPDIAFEKSSRLTFSTSHDHDSGYESFVALR